MQVVAGVLAPLAHHLRAPFLPLDQNVANGAPLNRRGIEGTVGPGRFHRRWTATQKILKEVAAVAAVTQIVVAVFRSH